MRREQQNVIGGEDLATLPLKPRCNGIFGAPALRNYVVPLPRFQVGNRRPHRAVDHLWIVERIVVGSRNAQELVIDPDVRDRLRDVLADRRARLAEEVRQLRDGQLGAAGTSNPAGVGVECVSQPRAGRKCKSRYRG